VENNLAAQQAIKHAKAQLDATIKAAYSQGVKAARIRKAGGTATEQRLADHKADELKQRVETMRTRLELTKQLVQIEPEDKGPSAATVERKEKQNVASKQAEEKTLGAKCMEAKTSAKVACAEAERQASQSIAEKQSEQKEKEASDKIKDKQKKEAKEEKRRSPTRSKGAKTPRRRVKIVTRLC